MLEAYLGRLSNDMLRLVNGPHVNAASPIGVKSYENTKSTFDPSMPETALLKLRPLLYRP